MASYEPNDFEFAQMRVHVEHDEDSEEVNLGQTYSGET